MATIWKGAINFGLINVPVKLLSASAKERISFRTLHANCKTPINQKRWCSECQREVPYEDTIKGYEYEKGSFVEITEQELKSIPVKSTKYIQILDFINLNEVDPIYYEKAYFLAPEAAGEKPYLILFKAMEATNTVAVSKITIRDKEHLCIVRVYDDILMLNTMFFGNEIKSASEINMKKIEKKIDVSTLEMSMAKEIIKNLTKPFDIDSYRDEYYNELMTVIKAKINGKEIVHPAAKRLDNNQKTTDLFEKLKASVEAAKKQAASSKENIGEKNIKPIKKTAKEKGAKSSAKTKPLSQKKSSTVYVQ